MGNMKEKSIIFYIISHELFYLAMNHHCDKKFVQIVAIMYIYILVLGMRSYNFIYKGTVSQYISFNLFEAAHVIHVIFYLTILIISSFRPVSILLTHVQETTVCTFVS